MKKSCNNCDHRVVCHWCQVIPPMVPAWMNWKVAQDGIKDALAASCPEYKPEENSA